MEKWNGTERRCRMHEAPLAECLERYKRLEDKIALILEVVNSLRDKANEINGRYEHHLEEAIPFRAIVAQHEKRFTENDSYKRQLTGILVSVVIAILLQVGSFLYMWGTLSKQVEVNTGRLTGLENIHPRTVDGTK
jgi:hypothetical protein